MDEVSSACRIYEDLGANRARPFEAIDDGGGDAVAVADGTRQMRVEKLFNTRLVKEVVVGDAHVLDAGANAVENRQIADRTAVVWLISLVVRKEPRRAALRETPHELVSDAAKVLYALVWVKEERRRVAVCANAPWVAIVLHENRPLAGPRRGNRRANSAWTRADDADIVVAKNGNII